MTGLDKLSAIGVPFKGYLSAGRRQYLQSLKMKRGRIDHGLIHADMSSKRIVRRKVSSGRRSLSPLSSLEQRRREVRTTSSSSVLKYEDKYLSGGGGLGGGGGGGGGDKYSSKYPSKYEEEDMMEDKYGRFEPVRSHKGNEEREMERGARGRRVSSRDHGTNHTSLYRPEKFDYSLRIGSLDVDMLDNELKTSLFDRFKRYGYVNIKVLGHGRERHAFINFTRQDCAKHARKEMADFMLHNVPLKTEWSKSTLVRFPDISERQHRTSMAGSSQHSSRNQTADERYESYTGTSGRDTLTPRSSIAGGGEKGYSTRDLPSRSSRNISYKTSHSSLSASSSRQLSSPQSLLPSTSSSLSRHEPRTVMPITDPTATRTLFVGNLEQDITERELRDLFGPYGRIESVDIKTQRATGFGYAFVKFLTINDAINAKNDMHGRKYGEYRLKIGFGRGSPTGKVWIGNLTGSVDLSEVRHELDRFGLIRKLDYSERDNHAFIQFDSLDAAQAAVASLSNYRIRNSGRTLKIDLCKPLHMRDDFHDDFPSHQTKHDRSHTTDDSFIGLKRRSREQNSTRRVSDEGRHNRTSSLSDSFRGGERFGSSSLGRGKGRENIRTRYRKRLHSPVRVGGDYKHRSVEMNGTDYHAKRPRIANEDTNRRDRDRNAMSRVINSKERELTTRKPVSEQNGSPHAKPTDRKPEEKKPVTSIEPPVLEPTLSDIAAAKDTALKLDDAPEPMSITAREGGGVICTEPSGPENLTDFAKLYPVAWLGNMVLKNTGFPTRMHLVGGDPSIAEALLRNKEGREYLVSLRITQRLRLEPPRLEEVNKRIASAGPGGHCILLALPGPNPASLSPDQGLEPAMQLRPLKSLVSYLKQKEAAGIVALSVTEGSDTASASGDKDVVGVLHAFPPCEFSQMQLKKIAPRLGDEPSKEDHIVVLLVKGNV